MLGTGEKSYFKQSVVAKITILVIENEILKEN